MKKIVYILISGLLLGCVNNDDLIKTSFTDEESQTINRIIEFYDDFIYSQTDTTYPIEKAYNSFLNKNVPLILESGSLSPLIPNDEDKINFYRTLNKKALSEIYNIKDTVVVFSISRKEKRKVYRPFSFDLNYIGKYVDYLKRLSSRNSFFKKYYDDVMASGGISPTAFSMMLNNYEEIDFSRKEERLVYIITILELHETREP